MWYAACKWMKDRPVEDLKMMSVLLTLISKMNFNLGKVAAAELAGSVVDRTGRSVRGYVSDFARNGGRFSPYRRGRHYRLSITSHEDFRHKAAEWAERCISDLSLFSLVEQLQTLPRHCGRSGVARGVLWVLEHPPQVC